MKRKSTSHERQVFYYLNDLRLSGITNMFGAVPHIEAMFGTDRPESKRLLVLWMNNFNQENNYNFIND